MKSFRSEFRRGFNQGLFNRGPNGELLAENAGTNVVRFVVGLVAAFMVVNLFLPQQNAGQSTVLTLVLGALVYAGLQFVSNKDMQTPEPLGNARNHNWFIVVTIVLAVASGLLSSQMRVAGAVVLVGWFAYTIWRRPALAAFIAMFSAALAGGPMILIAAPVTVMLARRDMRLRIGEARSVSRTLKTLALAAVVFLIALLFADSALGNQGSGSGEADSVGEGSESPLARLSDWIRGRGTDSVPDRLVRVPQGAAAPEEDPTRWWLLVLVIGLLIAAAALWYWLRRRRRGQIQGPAGPAVADPLARLETLGAAVGRPRRQHEGAISYAEELSEFTGDQRLAGTGNLVSGQVYASASAHGPSVEADLVALEQAPPQAPPQPSRRERIAERFRDSTTRRGLVGAGLAIVAITAVVWVATTNSVALREPHRMNELSARLPSESPDAWHELMALDDDSVQEWQACRGYGIDGGLGTTTSAATTGIEHTGESLAASVSVSHDDDRKPTYVNWAIAEGDDSLLWSDYALGQPPSRDVNAVWNEYDDFSAVPHGPFASVAETLEALGVQEPVQTEHVDAYGWPFTRYESKPLDYFTSDLVYENLPGIGGGDGEHMWAVDVWTNATGAPERVRILIADQAQSWQEWRRLPAAQSVRLATAQCPIAGDQNTAEWAGYESWEPSRLVDPQIGFDAEGNPYDTYYWEEPTASTADVERLGELDGPIAELGVGDIFALVNEDPTPPIKVATEWSAGASIDLLSRPDGWPTGALVTVDGGAPITRWVVEADADIYSTFVTLTTADDYPSLTTDELDGWLESMWGDGDPLITISFADQRITPVTVLTLSDATRVLTGRDAQGQIVAVLMWDEGMAWRELDLAGTPPPFVADREAQLRDCLAGIREIESNGRCLQGESDY